MPLKGNGLCNARHLSNTVDHVGQRFTVGDIEPRRWQLVTKPGPLPFGELAGANFDRLDRVSQVALAFQVLNDLPIPERLHGHFVCGKPPFQELLGFGDQSASKHRFHSLSDPCLKVFVFARQSHEATQGLLRFLPFRALA